MGLGNGKVIRMIKATIIERSYPNYNKPPYEMNTVNRKELTIEAESEDELLALFFREYDNRYKYVNSIGYSFKEEVMQEKYKTWFSDVRNYANNGGDMW